MIRGNNDGEATNPTTTQGGGGAGVTSTPTSDQTTTTSTTDTPTIFPLARTQNVNVVSVLPPNRVGGVGVGPQYVTTNQQFLAVASAPGGSITGTLRPNQGTSIHPLSLPHPQQQHQALYTVGTSSNLARILSSTHGYVQVRYGSPVATVASGLQPQTVSVSSIRSPVANVIATTMGVSKTPIVSSNPIDNTKIVGSPTPIGSAPTVVTWMRPSTPTSPTVNRLLPQRLTFNREQQTVRWPIVTTTTLPVSVTTVTTSPAIVRSVANRHKRVKVEGGGEDPVPPDVVDLRRSVVEYRTVEATACKQSYLDHMSELFFLQNGLNIMDYLTWKKRSNPLLMAYLRANALDSEDEEQNGSLIPSLFPSSVAVTTTTTAATTTTSVSKSFSEVKVPISGGTPVATCTTLPAAVVQQGKYHVPGKPQGGRHGMVFGNYQPSLPQSKTFHSSLTPGGTSLSSNFSTVSSSQSSISASFTTTAPSTKSQATLVPGVTNEPRVAARAVPSTSSTPSLSTNVVQTVVSSPHKVATTVASSSHGSSSPLKTPRSASFGSGSPARLQTRQHSISAVYDSTLGSQEEIVERAKQEAYVMQKVSELRKEGLWSERRLPKVQEPPRTKAHWDYLLEEMVWLATDFSQERKWKKATAKKCARMCHKFHEEQKLREERAEKDAEQKLKRIASVVAKEIKQFWANVEKLVEFKQQSRLEEKRKRALDHQLNFIVDQTEKYSSWLAQGMNKSLGEDGQVNAMSSSLLSRSSSPGNLKETASDVDFEPASDDSDDEETIAKEEEIEVDAEAQKMELDLLQKEGEAPLEDILKSLPPEILERPATPLVSEEDEDDEEVDVDVAGPSSSVKNVGDNEFHVSSNETTSDDESTMAEQEALEREVDHARELEELKDEGEMTLEELADKYCAAYDSDFQMEGSEESSDNDEDNDSDYDEDSSDENEEEVADMGLESLVDPVKRADTDEMNVESDGPGNEITDIVATAESLKPKGYTYQTTQVATKVPFLLKHQLREYQHIGLDWLVTMYERKLNGILADEMGLGKTIQTIALLAHLACEKGIWGPHLIVVPTSVMLNWEMEIKKWCPAFKILTYYGNVKERKQKRQGWTKPNTFHVCITSYKLVIQDHQSFRRKKWKYFILDEAQNIKNFKSQRWQLLLNFQSQRRLLLTGTPLQNSLMELWSLMHFLMPNVFHSHRDFKEWFANPVSGMIEGSHDYNRELISRLHKVLRPFLLRRLKSEVEKQLPSKYEHVVMCRLSKRQRFLYDDFMSQAKTKETLSSGSFMSVINVLMQLRKVCNHPNLFESRPTISPFRMQAMSYETASLCSKALEYDPFKVVDLFSLNLLLADLELCLTAFAAHRIKKFQAPKKLIEEIDSSPPIPPKCPPGKIKLHVRTTSSTAAQKSTVAPVQPVANSVVTTPSTSTPPVANVPGVQIKTVLPCPPATLATATPVSLSSGYTIVTVPAAVRTIAPTAITTSALGHHTGYTLQLVQQPTSNQVTLASVQSGSSPVVASAPITVQIQQTQHGPRLTVPSAQLAQIPSGFAQLVQTSTGQHILLTSNSPQTVLKPVNAVHSTSNVGQATTSAARLTVTLSTSAGRPVTAAVEHPAVNQPRVSAPLSVLGSTSSAMLSTISKPIGRVQPLNVVTVSSPASSSVVTTPKTVFSQPVKMVTRATTKVDEGHKDSKMSGRSTTVPSVKSLFCLEEVIERRRKHKRERLERLAKFNTRRCEACPIYGSDLIKAVTVVDDTDPVGPAWRGMGYVHCLKATSLSSHPKHYWNQSEALGAAVGTPESLLKRLHDILSRFVFLVPPVLAPDVTMHVSHPSPSRFREEYSRATLLRSVLSQRVACLHSIASAMTTQFPDPRLIQYDCGKLQTLDRLLRSLKNDGRRVLIFTQMTRMLDVLEQFLNYHGHIYLRLDGTTRVEQRQALMERFNADRRIFCFILSTRSGGIGVNLTGADTVVFYDSDWNPTMDAQAQDRCHRIGQTRDVHIYRLISERTVEENILKKANQKRLLGEVAIEGGNFTTAFFKKHTIKELFEMDFGAPKKEALVSVIKHEPKDDEVATSSDAIDLMSTTQLEHALANAEEDTDVLAAKTAKAEAAAELAEFDESISYDGDSRGDDDSSKVGDELGSLISQLTPIERYAMTFLESTQEPFSLEQLKQAEDEIEAQKKDWELGRLQALKEEEERRASLEDNDIPFTYSREDAYNQIFISPNTGEQMPVWAPPTPPRDETDFYVDYTVCFLYEPNIMTEAQLPPVFVKKDHKRARLETSIVRKQKLVRKDDSVTIPRSLFDRPSAAVLKMRRDVKSQKSRPTVKLTSSYKPPTIVNKPVVDTHQDSPEWLIHEDWSLLQAVQGLLELPLNLIVLSPAHTPNWDLVSDVVNATSRMYRSPKQCKSRYELVVIPREEGKILYDTNPKKQKKSKGIYRTKNNRPMRTSQLFIQDNNLSFTHLYHQRFETIKSISNKRMPTLKPMLVNTSIRNPKHAAVLAETGINNEQPLTPVQVAINRADRIAREKLKTQVLANEQLVQRQPQPQPVSPQVQVTPPAHTPAAGAPQSIIGLSPGGITAQQLQNVIGRMAVASPGIASAVAAPSPPVIQSPIRTQRGAPQAVVMQEVVGGVAQVRGLTSTVAPTVVSMANLVASQVQTAVGTPQRVNPTGITSFVTGSVPPQTVTSPQLTGKVLTASQIQQFRTQSLYKQQQQQQQQRLQQVAQQQIPLQSPKVPLAVTSLLSPGVATVQVAQAQQQQQRFQAVKQGVPRAMTEAEVAQLIRRQHLLQQQKAAAAAAAQVTQVQVPAQGQLSSQLLAQAQLQQQSTSAATGQTSLATLVKTVSTPTSLGTSSSVTIPVGTVGMAGVNINVSLPQVKATIGTAKGTVVTQQQQQQLQQVKLQQQLQQRKLQQLQQQQQKAAHLAHVQGKAQLGTVQIMQQTAAAQNAHKALPAGVTVQQLQQVIKQVQPQALQHLTQVSAAGTTIMAQATVVSQAQIQQALSHSVLAKSASISTAAGHTASTLGQATVHARLIPVSQAMAGIPTNTLGQQQHHAVAGGTLKQTIQVVTATTPTQLIQSQIRTQAVGTASTNIVDVSGRQQAMIGHGTPVATTVTTMTLPPGMKVVSSAGQQMQPTHVTIGVPQGGNVIGGQPQPPSGGSGR